MPIPRMKSQHAGIHGPVVHTHPEEFGHTASHMKRQQTAINDSTSGNHLDHHQHSMPDTANSTQLAADVRLPFNMLRLVLDELRDRLAAQRQVLPEIEIQKMADLASEFQQLYSKSRDRNCHEEDKYEGEVRLVDNVVEQYRKERKDRKKAELMQSNPCEPPDREGLENETKGDTTHEKVEAEERPHELEDWQQNLIQIFKALDGDGSGSLSVEELRRAMIEAGVPIARITKLIKEADSDNSGEIEVKEWINAISSKSSSSIELRALGCQLSQRMEAGTLFVDANTTKSKYVLHPASRLRIVFDTIVFTTCCYLGIVSPFVVSWEDGISESTMRVFNIVDAIIIVLFAFDMILSFFTGYFNSEDELILDHRMVAMHYLQTWFLLDFLTTFPFGHAGMRGGNHNQVFKVLKCAKIFKIVKMIAPNNVDWSEYSDTLDTLSNSSIVQMLSRRSTLLIVSFLLCHCMACGMKFIEADEPGCLKSYRDVQGKVFSEYLAALYWSMTTLTTVGYGDILPTSDGERVYTIFAEVIGGGFYGYVVGCICSMVGRSDLNSSSFYDRMELIQAWVNHHKLPLHMKRRLRRYFKNFLSEKSAIDEAEIWRDLTPELQREVGQYIIQTDVVEQPLFDGLALGTVVRLQSILQKISVPSERVVIQEGEAGTAMYIIVFGSVRLARAGVKEKNSVSKLGMGQSFGEEILLGFTETYEYTVTTLEKTKMQMILEDDFLSVFSHMPNIIERMRRNAKAANPEWIEKYAPCCD